MAIINLFCPCLQHHVYNIAQQSWKKLCIIGTQNQLVDELKVKAFGLKNLFLRRSCNDYFMLHRPPSIKFYFYFHYYHSVKHKIAQRVRSFGQSELERDRNTFSKIGGRSKGL